jgi:hypothetical protein
MIIRGLLHRLACTFWMKKRSIFSHTSKSAITPSFSGRIVLIRPGVRPHHPLRLDADRDRAAVGDVDRDDDGSLRTMPWPAA